MAKRTRAEVALAVLVVVLAAVLGGVLLVRDDDDSTDATTTTTSAADTTSTTTTTTTEQPADDTAVWPPPGTTPPADAAAAARAFAVDYLGFVDPVLGPFQQGDSRSGELEVRPMPDGPVTTVLLRELSGSTGWSVLGAATANIEVTAPGALDVVTSPIALVGRALAFEGTVQVEVRDDVSPDPLGATFVTGGGDELRPFEGEVTFTEPGSPAGAIVLRTYGGEDDRVWEASVLRVRFDA